MALVINGIDRPSQTLPEMEFPLPDGSTTIVQFLPFDRPTPASEHSQNGETINGHRIRRTREAILHIVRVISRDGSTNEAFRRLPRGRTLAQLISELPDIVICLSPGNFTVIAAAPVVTDPHLTAGEMRLSLTGKCFHRIHASGRSIEAAIIHELAHLNGASGDPSSRQAENILRHCRMGDQFDPTSTG